MSSQSVCLPGDRQAASSVGGGRTFMTGAQKCTVLKPMGLSHMRLIQPTCGAACCSALAVDCHLRPHCCRCWPRKACWKPDAREKACRVWAAADAEEKSGRDARVKAAAEEDMARSLLPVWVGSLWVGENRRSCFEGKLLGRLVWPEWRVGDCPGLEACSLV